MDDAAAHVEHFGRRELQLQIGGAADAHDAVAHDGDRAVHEHLAPRIHSDHHAPRHQPVALAAGLAAAGGGGGCGAPNGADQLLQAPVMGGWRRHGTGAVCRRGVGVSIRASARID